MADEALSDERAADMIAETIDLVCQLRLLPGGRRVVAELAEVAGVEGGRVLTNALVTLGPDSEPMPTGLRPRAAERLEAADWHPDRWLNQPINHPNGWRR